MQNIHTKDDMWTRVLAITAATLATIAGFGGAFFISNVVQRINTFDGIVQGLSISVAEQIVQADIHEAESKYWKRQIEENHKWITRISTETSARPDPFTGTEGQKLEGRVDSIERRLMQMQRPSTK